MLSSRKVLLVVSLFAIRPLYGQSVKLPGQYDTEIGGYTSSAGQTPFWQQSNQFGVVPTRTPALTLRASAHAEYDTSKARKSKFDYGYGARVVANAVTDGRVLLPELYAKVRFGALEASVGRRQRIYGLVDTTLSSGSYSWSGNALPIPQIELSVPTFTPIPFTKGWVSFQGSYAHGWMNPTGFVNHSMLHQKTLYLRIGRPDDKIRLYGGFTHQAVWGGEINDLSLINNPAIAKESQLPARFRDYVYVVTGFRLGRPDDEDRLANFDYTNRIGNHLGSVDVGADVNLGTFNLFAYRQQLFDDGSLYYFINIADGLNGLRLRQRNPQAKVREILIEFLNTTSQGGDVFDLTTSNPQSRGRDNYFNHSQFRDGWSYRQRGIGTPFITPALGPNGEWPFGIFTNNNRVRVFHVGMAGSLSAGQILAWAGRVNYQAKFSFSRNYGTYNDPFSAPLDQFSGILSLSVPFGGGFAVSSSLGVDSGELYPANIGLYLGLRKVWHKKSVD